MIFKYYNWNKFSNLWDDMKIYCSLCNADYRNPPLLLSKIYRTLTSRKIVSFPLENLYFTNHSSTYTARYHLFARVNGKNLNFGKLEEIPNKNTEFKSSINSWDEIKAAPVEPVRRAVRGIRPANPQFFIDEMVFMPEPAAPRAPEPVPVVRREPLRYAINPNNNGYVNVFADPGRVEPVRNIVENVPDVPDAFDDLWEEEPF